MKLRGWTGNRLDSPVEYDVDELATEFLESGLDEWWRGWPMDRKVSTWLAMSGEKVLDDGTAETKVAQGKNLTWDVDDPGTVAAYDELIDTIIEKRR